MSKVHLEPAVERLVGQRALGRACQRGLEQPGVERVEQPEKHTLSASDLYGVINDQEVVACQRDS